MDRFVEFVESVKNPSVPVAAKVEPVLKNTKSTAPQQIEAFGSLQSTVTCTTEAQPGDQTYGLAGRDGTSGEMRKPLSRFLSLPLTSDQERDVLVSPGKPIHRCFSRYMVFWSTEMEGG